MRRIFIFITFLITTAYTCSGQTGTYAFRAIDGDTCKKAEIVIGWDYIRVTTNDHSGQNVRSYSSAYPSTPDYNFSFGDSGNFWISKSTSTLKFLGKFNIKKNKFTYIRLNNKEYR